MIQIGVKSNIDRLIASLDAFSPDQFPFAVAKALTKTAQDARDEVRKEMPAHFTLRRTKFILSGITIEPARKDHLVALVLDRQAFMAKQEYGELRVPTLGGHFIAIPMSGVRPTPHSLVPTELRPRNLPRAAYATSKKTGMPYASRKGPKGAAFILRADSGLNYLVRREGGSLQFLYLLKPEADVKPRLRLAEITMEVVKQRFSKNLMIAIRDAMATRRAGGTLTEDPAV